MPKFKQIVRRKTGATTLVTHMTPVMAVTTTPTAAGTLSIFIPGLWAECQDYDSFLMACKKVWGNSATLARPTGTCINYNKLLEQRATYTYFDAYEYIKKQTIPLVQQFLQEESSRKEVGRIRTGQNAATPASRILLIGHSLGAAIALKLAVDIQELLRKAKAGQTGAQVGTQAAAGRGHTKSAIARVPQLTVLVLNPAGNRMNPLAALVTKWLPSSLQMLSARHQHPIRRGVFSHIKRWGVLAPLRLIWRLSKQEFLTQDVVQSLANRSKNTRIFIVGSKHDKITPSRQLQQLSKAIRADRFIELDAGHFWLLKEQDIEKFCSKFRGRSQPGL